MDWGRWPRKVAQGEQGSRSAGARRWISAGNNGTSASAVCDRLAAQRKGVDITMDNIDSCNAGYVEFGPLTALSLQHTPPGVTPDAPTNEDRARAFRNAQPVALANNFEWPFRRVVGGQQAVARLVAAGEAKPGTAKPRENAGVRWLTPVHALHDYVAGRSQRSDMQDRPASILPISKALIGTTR